ncbi:MAG TPA: dienelactone hydrolase family protein [Cyclobacteriaceae bacterium]|nr:dienelactone hydrolase family protein [Cyclobacteriaceae bacterium]HRK55272.1 dienelactone hydrolase family protein [Cyclobacteriaceae bacterium]
MAQTVKAFTIEISERTGTVSGLAIIPKNAAALLVLAHGAGAGMTHTFMEELALELATHGIATLRYNFPYMEKGSRRPDPPAVAEKTVIMVLEFAHKKYPKLPLFAGGKSFGGRMTSQRVSKLCPEFLQGIVFFGFPLHAIGKPGMERAAHLNDINIPMLFLQGTKDKLAEIDLIKKVIKKLKTATLEQFEGADHSFKVSKQNILPDLASTASEWMRRLS